MLYLPKYPCAGFQILSTEMKSRMIDFSERLHIYFVGSHTLRNGVADGTSPQMASTHPAPNTWSSAVHLPISKQSIPPASWVWASPRTALSDRIQWRPLVLGTASKRPGNLGFLPLETHAFMWEEGGHMSKWSHLQHPGLQSPWWG